MLPDGSKTLVSSPDIKVVIVFVPFPQQIIRADLSEHVVCAGIDLRFAQLHTGVIHLAIGIQ